MARAPENLRRRLNADTLARAAGSVQREWLVFLGGPFIEPGDRSKSSTSPASALRFELYERLNADGFVVSLGEFREVIDAYREDLGAHNNAAVAEIRHAQDVADVTVMIVDSPGSFAEIGAFSMKRDICRKMLIISDVQHKHSTGYVANGPYVLASAFEAKLEYRDLTAVDEIYEIVAAFIKEKNTLRLLEQMVIS